eukprot:gnl/TRDRNA2_/TRDRNA2_156135_c1_seq6.p2 gnl/TRDRNA2_/TRDRNA2_156135_c1~~gnl/TRDRNA2_/TRDRNA2_156135_c1_seq6.p2  ORF type:complete len:135 (+),score=21.29 gnl/TRDRNA2_/TRDRNA2_156135_c1_seq6:182-586(+)
MTPIWLDQMYTAPLVNAFQWGTATKPLQILSAQELGATIRHCATDKGIRQMAQVMQFSVKTERGLPMAIEFIESFVKEEVLTGRWWRQHWGNIKVEDPNGPVQPESREPVPPVPFEIVKPPESPSAMTPVPKKR